jgi:hypothetical protein
VGRVEGIRVKQHYLHEVGVYLEIDQFDPHGEVLAHLRVQRVLPFTPRAFSCLGSAPNSPARSARMAITWSLKNLMERAKGKVADTRPITTSSSNASLYVWSRTSFSHGLSNASNASPENGAFDKLFLHKISILSTQWQHRQSSSRTLETS